MLYFSIQNARGGRERSPRLRGGLRTDGFIWSDHGRTMLGSWSDRPRIGNDVSQSFQNPLFKETYLI